MLILQNMLPYKEKSKPLQRIDSTLDDTIRANISSLNPISFNNLFNVNFYHIATL